MSAVARRRKDAARQRQRRQREKRGVVCATVEIGEPVFDALEQVGLLTGNDQLDRRRLSAVLAAVLVDWASDPKMSRVTSTALGLSYDGRRKDR